MDRFIRPISGRDELKRKQRPYIIFRMWTKLGTPPTIEEQVQYLLHRRAAPGRREKSSGNFFFFFFLLFFRGSESLPRFNNRRRRLARFRTFVSALANCAFIATD